MHIYAVFRKFRVLAQKPPGGHEGAAKRHISFNPVSGFCLELLGGGHEGAARRCIIVVVVLLFLFVNFIIC